MSDYWKAYDEIENLEGYHYTHEKVNHSKEFVNEGGYHTNNMESQWRATKTNLPQKRTRKRIQEHLFEKMWRNQNLGNTWQALLTALREVEYDVGPEADARAAAEEAQHGSYVQDLEYPTVPYHV